MLRPSESLRAAVDAKKAEMGLEPNASFAGMHVRRGDKVKARPTRYCSPIRPTHFKPLFLEFNSVSGLVSKSWYRSRSSTTTATQHCPFRKSRRPTRRTIERVTINS